MQIQNVLQNNQRQLESTVPLSSTRCSAFNLAMASWNSFSLDSSATRWSCFASESYNKRFQ